MSEAKSKERYNMHYTNIIYNLVGAQRDQGSFCGLMMERLSFPAVDSVADVPNQDVFLCIGNLEFCEYDDTQWFQAFISLWLKNTLASNSRRSSPFLWHLSRYLSSSFGHTPHQIRNIPAHQLPLWWRSPWPRSSGSLSFSFSSSSSSPPCSCLSAPFARFLLDPLVPPLLQ